MIEIERLVFACPDLQLACSDLRWKNFCISSIRETRPFLRSRYILFKNIMLELLQVVEHEDASNFVFLEEWKRAKRPLWISIGLKVENLKDALAKFKEHNIASKEEFLNADLRYKKGFRHHSSLLSKQWQGKHLYLTEYDNDFLNERHAVICSDSEKKERYRIEIPASPLDVFFDDRQLFQEEKCIKLKLFNELTHKTEKYDFGWISFH